MINTSYSNRFTEMIPAEFRLVRQAKSGSINAFIELYDLCVEHVYRYIHFLAPNSGVAERLTFQVFFSAWDQINRYPMFRSSFIMWIYSIARNHVNTYTRTHRNAAAPDNIFKLAARGGKFREEFQFVREGMKSLVVEHQHILVLKFVVGMSDRSIARLLAQREDDVRNLQVNALCALTDQMKRTDSKTITRHFRLVLEDCLSQLMSGASTLESCLLRHPEHAPHLRPLLETALLLELGRDVKPLPTFNAYTHEALIQYIRTHPPQPRVNLVPVLRRTALSFAVLVIAVLVTGTTYAQAALPGEAFYPWKLTSEQVWLAFSPNQVAVHIALAERRLEEWIAVANDPKLSFIAMNNYQEALAKLESLDNEATYAMIQSALLAQQNELQQAGLTSAELSSYLSEIAELLSNQVPHIPPTGILPVPTNAAGDNCPPNCDEELGSSLIETLPDNSGTIPSSGGVSDLVKDENNAGGVSDLVKDENNAGGVSDLVKDENNAGGVSDLVKDENNAGGVSDLVKDENNASGLGNDKEKSNNGKGR
jgi:DNA-directed RNA polymerase specialized sigma24 family protein/uncharacterized protein YidB (DUF937 family)